MPNGTRRDVKDKDEVAAPRGPPSPRRGYLGHSPWQELCHAIEHGMPGDSSSWHSGPHTAIINLDGWYDRDSGTIFNHAALWYYRCHEDRPARRFQRSYPLAAHHVHVRPSSACPGWAVTGRPRTQADEALRAIGVLFFLSSDRRRRWVPV